MNKPNNVSLCAVFIVIFITSGCSVYMAKNGQYSDVLKDGVTRQEVNEKLGPPTTSRQSGKFPGDNVMHCIIETYLVKGKLPNENLSTTYMELDVGTFGLGEIILFPIEIIRSIYTSFTIKEVTVRYCQNNGAETVTGNPTYTH